MDKKENYSELKKLASGEGMALFGVADITQARKDFILPGNISSKFAYGISMGYELSQPILETVEGIPNQVYYFHYQRVNILLDQTALKIASLIQKKGMSAFPVPASQVIDWQKQLGSVSHREIARLAGHGWYGRNNLLVNKNLGSRVRYVSVLTDLPLDTDGVSEDGCGSCRRCVALCPAKAILDTGFDRAACHARLKEFSKIQGIGQMICGVCIKACPGKSAEKNK
jgi:epoxyqueuosine reductase QueG